MSKELKDIITELNLTAIPADGAFSSVPRHREIKESLVRKICDDLGIPRP